jgi:3-hydroxybutyryl-CoA dehydrogenase
VESVAVIGAGPLGTRLALHCARAGFPTTLEDLMAGSLRRASDELAATVAKDVAAGRLTAEDAEQIRSRVTFASSVDDAAREADVVIECVPDESESKLEIIVLLDKLCRPGTILATTATCLSVEDMAAMTFRPGEVVGLLTEATPEGGLSVELVAGPGTSSQTVARLLKLAVPR